MAVWKGGKALNTVSKSILGVITVVVILIAIPFGYVKLLRPYLDLRRQAIQSSQQYTETKQRLLMELVIEYHSTENEAVKSAVANKMRLEIQNIPESEVPSEVIEILRGH